MALLAGCAAPDTLGESPDSPAAAPDARRGGPDGGDGPIVPGTPVTFEVASRSGPATIHALAWWSPAKGDTVLLAVHGRGGVKEHWDFASNARDSLAQREARGGRSVVAIDLPHYGESRAALDATTGPDDHASVLAQVAAALRTGDYEAEDEPRTFEKVIGLGHSMGGAAIDLAQATQAPFDAIVVTGWAHGGRSDEFRACTSGLAACPPLAEMYFHVEQADPALVDAIMGALEPSPALHNCTGAGFCESLPGGPGTTDGITALIRVPVLLMLGAEDFLWDASEYEREPTRYPNTKAELVIVPDTGHFLFHHHSHAQAHDALAAWIDERG